MVKQETIVAADVIQAVHFASFTFKASEFNYLTNFSYCATVVQAFNAQAEAFCHPSLVDVGVSRFHSTLDQYLTPTIEGECLESSIVAVVASIPCHCFVPDLVSN